jgi:N-methylhydantoinase A
LIEIGRQDRPDLYALCPVKPTPLVPRHLRFELDQRVWPAHGMGAEGKADSAELALERVTTPEAADWRDLRTALAESEARSVAICLLHSWADPAIETEVRDHLADLGLPMTCSAEILPEYREHERFSTAVVNAALVPVMGEYLKRLGERLGESHRESNGERHGERQMDQKPGRSDGAQGSLSILQSCGGTLSAERAAAEPVRVLLSGPAGGVLGAARAAGEAGLLGGAHPGVLTLDMGGTSTDVAFHLDADAGGGSESDSLGGFDSGLENGSGDDPGGGGGGGDDRDSSGGGGGGDSGGGDSGGGGSGGLAQAVTDTTICGHPIAVPSLDIHTIGCGGGSLVTLDSRGILHVGPESAGADPGPVCHGRGQTPTVTDAHVYLGHIAEGPFLDTGFPLDTAAVKGAFEELGRRLDVAPEEAALGVLEVARAAMRRAMGVMSMQRGQDPAQLPLVAFGGAGGLHGAALAASLDMAGALVPDLAGILSARGMAAAAATRDHSRGIVAPLSAWGPKRRADLERELAEQGRAELVEAGHPAEAIRSEASLDLRYRGQSFELTLPEGGDREEAFHQRHKELYGWNLCEGEIELVNLRVRALVSTPVPRPRPVPDLGLPRQAIRGERPAVFGAGPGEKGAEALSSKAILVDRRQLEPGHRFSGPAIVEDFSGTCLVPPSWKARVTNGGHLWLER